MENIYELALSVQALLNPGATAGCGCADPPAKSPPRSSLGMRARKEGRRGRGGRGRTEAAQKVLREEAKSQARKRSAGQEHDHMMKRAMKSGGTCTSQRREGKQRREGRGKEEEGVFEERGMEAGERGGNQCT